MNMVTRDSESARTAVSAWLKIEARIVGIRTGQVLKHVNVLAGVGYKLGEASNLY
jgi:hypothetical protein